MPCTFWGTVGIGGDLFRRDQTVIRARSDSNIASGRRGHTNHNRKARIQSTNEAGQEESISSDRREDLAATRLARADFDDYRLSTLPSPTTHNRSHHEGPGS
jgi:hypothetical protein